MSIDIVVVDVGVLVVIAWIVWYFWVSKGESARVAVLADGVQEADVVVLGGYSPNRLEVAAGLPVRLRFTRRETSACSERVEFPDFELSRRLPEGETVTIDLGPLEPGEYAFTCQMGMLRGALIVRGDGPGASGRE